MEGVLPIANVGSALSVHHRRDNFLFLENSQHPDHGRKNGSESETHQLLPDRQSSGDPTARISLARSVEERLGPKLNRNLDSTRTEQGKFQNLVGKCFGQMAKCLDEQGSIRASSFQIRSGFKLSRQKKEGIQCE